jgi:hypothetical protein
MPRVVFFYMDRHENRTPYGVAPSLRLNRRIRLRVKLVLNLVFTFQINSKNKPFITCVLQPRALNPNPKVWKNDSKGRGMHCKISSKFELMVKVGKLVQKFKNLFFRNDIPEKWLNK